MTITNVLQSNCFRSGSALHSRMMNAHPNISISCDIIKFYTYCYKRYMPLNDESVLQMIDEVGNRLRERFQVSIDTDECWKMIKGRPLRHSIIYTSLLQHFNAITNNEPKQIVGESESLVWSKIPDFLRMFPNGKAILMVRDPRDVLVSFRKHTIAPNHDYLISIFNSLSLFSHCRDYTYNYPDRFLPVRFEELKHDPVRIMRATSEFLGVEYHPDMVDDEKWVNNKGGKWRNTEVSAFYAEGDHLAPVGRWRRIILPEDLFLCEWICGQHMELLGMKREAEPLSLDIFNQAVNKITSSQVLQECFLHWCQTGEGVERYPLDPREPANWDWSYDGK